MAGSYGRNVPARKRSSGNVELDQNTLSLGLGQNVKVHLIGAQQRRLMPHLRAIERWRVV